MEILLLLIPLSLVLVAGIGLAFAWSVKSGQFDDLEGPAHRIVADDDAVRVPSVADAGTVDVSVPLTAVNRAGEGGR